MTTVERDVVDPGIREPGSFPLPNRVVGASPATRLPGAFGVGSSPPWSSAVAVLAAVLPVVTDPSGWFVFVAARWAVLAGSTALLLGGLAVTGRLRRLPALGWWATLTGVAVASAAGSGAARIALFGTTDRRAGAAMWLVHGVLFVVGGAVVRRPDDLRRIARGVSVGAVAVTVLVAAQRLGWAAPWGSGPRVRPGGPLGNADFLGAYAGLATLVGIGAAVDRAERDGWRLVHLVAALGASFCLVVSGTRGAWLGVVVGLVVFAVTAARRSGVPLRAAWAGVALVVVGLVGLGMWAGVAERLGTVTTGTAAGRIATWERTATVIGERPVLGWGPEGFAEGFGRAVDDTWEREYGRRLVPDRAHNGLLDVGAALGLVGLVAYVGTITATGRAVRRAGLASPSPLVGGIAAALVTYLVQQQFLFQLPDVDALAWLLAGGLVGLGASRPVPGGRGRRTIIRLAAGVALVALVLTTITAAVGVQADRSARRSSDERRSNPGAAVVDATRAVRSDPQTMHALVLADAALADGSDDALLGARTEVGATRSGAFDDGRLTLARSRLACATGFIDLIGESREELLDLLHVDPSRSDAWAELGEVDLLRDDPVAAQASFERATRLRPAAGRWWVRLALAAERAGDERTARDAIGRVAPAALDVDGLALRRRLLAGAPGGVSGR